MKPYSGGEHRFCRVKKRAKGVFLQEYGHSQKFIV